MCVRVTASITFCVCNNKSGVVARHATGEQYVKKQRIWEFHKKGNGRNKTKDRRVYKLHCRKHMKYCTKWLCKAIKNQKKEEENHLAAGKGLWVCVCICIGVCEPNCWNERLRHCSLGISPVTGTTCDASALLTATQTTKLASATGIGILLRKLNLKSMHWQRWNGKCQRHHLEGSERATGEYYIETYTHISFLCVHFWSLELQLKTVKKTFVTYSLTSMFICVRKTCLPVNI